MTPEQRRAAELLGRGYSQREVGRLVGRSERTIRAWFGDVDGFRQAAQAVQAETSDPMALDTLRLALGATRKDGSPDWSIRVSAAKALLTAPEPEPAPVVSVPPGGIVIYPDAIDAVLGEP